MKQSETNARHSIRSHVVSALAVCFLLLFLIILLIISSSMNTLLVRQEDESLRAQVQMAGRMLALSNDRLMNTTEEWAGLSYTYDYATGVDDTIYHSHFVPGGAYELNKVNLLTVLDAGDAPMFEQYYSYIEKQVYPPPDDLSAHYRRLGEVCRQQYVQALETEGQTRVEGIEGFVVEGEHVYYVAAYPIGSLYAAQPLAGTLVFGRLLDAEELDALSVSVGAGQKLMVVPRSTLALSAAGQDTLDAGEELMLRQGSSAVAYGALVDVYGAPTVALSLDSGREVYRAGVSIVVFNVLALAVCCLVILYIITKVLNRSLIVPLHDLSKRVDEVDMESAENTLPAGTHIQELHSLASSINRMLARIREEHDLVERKNQDLYNSANFDQLTGLHNRGNMTRQVEKMVEKAAQGQTAFTLFYFDLDRFKMLNDTLGHHSGDVLLGQVAGRMRERLGEDTVLSRMGGDKFMVMTESVTDRYTRQCFAEKIFELFVAPYQLRERQMLMSVSMGSSTYPYDGQNADTLVKNAEIAMYRAKELGAGLYVPYEVDLQNALQRRMLVENRLRTAINDGCGEFRAYFQPKVQAADGSIHQCEALIRWMPPGEGVVAPGDFIPQAEESGLIVPLTWWMIRECCRQGKRFAREGLPTSISINVPAQVLTHEDFLPQLEMAVAETGMDIRMLDIEITEGTLLEDMDKVNRVLAKLHQLGCEISVDDFGTGYSSLSYLHRLSLDRIKIDRSFIGDLSNEDNVAIVRAIVAMAKSLRMVVTAEGVEEKPQFRFLDEIQCEEIQGFWVSRPLPADDYIRFIKTWDPATLNE